MFQAIKLNIQYIKALNSCNISVIHDFLFDMLQRVSLKKAFKRKRYIWNFTRGKDFYKTLAQFISSYLLMDKTKEFAVKVYDEVINSTQSDEIKKAFTKAITKHTPFLTATSIQYMSVQRLEAIANQTDSLVYIEPMLKPLINRINQLEDEIGTLTEFM